MKASHYQIRHQYQPTNSTCSQTALAILLSHFRQSYTPQELEEHVPQLYSPQGKARGTINQQLATWCIKQGYEVRMVTADCQVIDQSWSELPKDELLAQLNLRKTGWEVPALGAEWTRDYANSYIDFIKSGGKLDIVSFISSDLIYELLESGPVLPLVCYNTLYGAGRARHDGPALEQEFPDAVNGRAANHSIVVYGNDTDGNFLIADPLNKPGKHTIEPERLIASIATAQIECDNLLFQIKKAPSKA